MKKHAEAAAIIIIAILILIELKQEIYEHNYDQLLFLAIIVIGNLTIYLIALWFNMVMGKRGQDCKKKNINKPKQ